MVEKSRVEKFLLALGLKSQGLKGLGLKLGVEKSGVEMSFNPFYSLKIIEKQTFYFHHFHSIHFLFVFMYLAKILQSCLIFNI